MTIADRIKKQLRESDLVARYGGDEFVVLLSVMGSALDVDVVIDKISQTVSQPITVTNGLGDNAVVCGCSIGYAHYPDHGLELENLISHADKAMYIIKQGRLK